MTGISNSAHSPREAVGSSVERGDANLRAIADWLGLAAAPAFAVMALMSAALGEARPDFLCSAMPGSSVLSGMVPMYALMSAFHLAPWLRLTASRRSGCS